MQKYGKYVDKPRISMGKSSSKRSRKFRSTLSSIPKAHYPRVMISRETGMRGEKIGVSRTISSSSFSGSHRESQKPDVCSDSKLHGLTACDDNGASNIQEEQMACTRITSSTEISGDSTEKCTTCKDCLECFVQERIKIVNPENELEEILKDRTRGAANPTVSTTGEEKPIFVDLTRDETKVTQKQTKVYCNVDTAVELVHSKKSLNATNDTRELRIMIADSSSKLHRTATGNSLATALRDRGPCVIPIQPNRSLPIRPAPPTPTRTASIAKNTRQERSPVLKLSKAILLDIVEVEQTKSNLKDEEIYTEERNREAERTLEDQMNLVPQISNLYSDAKRRIDDEKEKEKDTGKRRKSHEADSSQPREEYRDVLKDLSKDASSEFADKVSKLSQEEVLELWNEKKCSQSIVSTTEGNMGKEKELNNKTVPPLRLKKVVCEGTNNGYHEITPEAEKATNYRIVTGDTLRPDSVPTRSYKTMDVYQGSRSNRDNSIRRFPAKNDGYKLKYRRNRIRQKLKELRTKASDLAQQMYSTNVNDSDNSHHNTRFRQMMNCYEKQIENLSKLLNKLSSDAPISDDGVVDVDGDESIILTEEETTVIENETRNGGLLGTDVSPTNLSSSPEPPKLSPHTLIDYSELKSPGEISPPVLSRIYTAVPTNLNFPDEQSISQEENGWIATTETSSKSYEQEVDHTEIDKKWGSPTRIQNSQDVVDVEGDKVNFSDKVVQSIEDDNKIAEKEEVKEQIKGNDDLLTNQECEEIERIDFKITEPNERNTSTADETKSNMNELKCNETYTPMNNCQLIPSSSDTNTLQSQNQYGQPVIQNSVVIGEESQNAQEVTSSSQSVVLDSTPLPPVFAQVNPTVSSTNLQRAPLLKNSSEEVLQNENNNSRIMSEQFPTLGNWVARMSKKQTSKSKSKSKSQPIVPVPLISMEDTIRATRQETRKAATSNVNSSVSNVVNVASQWNTERWQWQHQQQRQQQLLQQVAAATPSQPLSSIIPSRSTIYPPISVTQFCANNYTIDPYSGAALNYHSTICPYGSYPYPSRLHPGTPLNSYHIPMQDPLNSSLRSIQHVDKRLSSFQESSHRYSSDIMKYSGQLTAGGYQHPTNFDFDRLRTTTATHNRDAAGSFPPLLLPPSALPSSTQQTIPRTSLAGYPTNNGQYGRNRMIPDMVAAAAAAAVVAAASFGRQRGPMTTYSRQDCETTSVSAVDRESSTLNRSSGSAREHLSDQQQVVADTNLDIQLNNSGYHQLHNILLDGLPFVRSDENFGQTSAFAINAQLSNPTSVSTSYKVPPVPISRVQLSTEMLRNDARNCDTPHLGKVNRSPDTLSNLECSNCGLAGSIFKCLGCEAAFYCNERCQTRHWSIHVEKCPKKMPKLKKVL